MAKALNWDTTAIVLVDPQVDVLTPQSVIWDLIGEQVAKRGIVDKLVRLRDEAQNRDIPVFYAWIEVSEEEYASRSQRNGLQQLMADRKMMIPEKGACFAPRLEPNEKTILLSPRRGPSPSHSDINLQLRQRGIETVVLAGMIANLCIEAHVRELTDAGYNAVVVADAVATTDDATHEATLTGFGMLATAVLSTDEVMDSMRQASVAV